MKAIDIIKENIWKNCLSAEKSEKGVKFKRFSNEQLESFGRNNDFFNARMNCSAGVCLDFYTNSGFIEFSYNVGSVAAREWITFDIYINNVLTEIVNETPIPKNGNVHYDITDDGLKRVSVYLPYSAQIFIDKLFVSDDAKISPVTKQDKTVLFLGDSITQGFDSECSSKTYATQVARLLRYELLNQGIGAMQFNFNLVNVDIGVNPDLIIVAYGTNDWNPSNTKEMFELNLTKFMESLTVKFPNTQINVISPIWRKCDDTIYYPKHYLFSQLFGAITDTCKKYKNVKVIDGMKLTSNNLLCFTDGLHPNMPGHNEYSLNLFRELIK